MKSKRYKTTAEETMTDLGVKTYIWSSVKEADEAAKRKDGPSRNEPAGGYFLNSLWSH